MSPPTSSSIGSNRTAIRPGNSGSMRCICWPAVRPASARRLPPSWVLTATPRRVAQYERGSLDTLLAVYIPAGKRKPLTPAHLAQLQQALAQPAGFASYGAMRQWLADTCGVQLSYNAVHKLVRYRLRAKLKVPRPSHLKNRRRHRDL